MDQAISLEQWYTQGLFAPHVKERRLVASTPTWMFDICQPSGDFPDPPVQDLVVIQDKSKARAICDFGAGRFRFDPGTISVVPSECATQITVENAHNIRVLGFLPTAMRRWVNVGEGAVDLGRLHGSSINSPFLHQLMDRIWEAGSADGGATSLYSDTALLMLWAELYREAQTLKQDIVRGGLAPWQLRRCEEFLNAHACENIGLEQLAALVSLSPFHFARAFKQTTGLPPHRYQLNLRIERAKALLVGTDVPVTEIAFEVGYESSQSLARLFRREVGASPSQYRHDHRF